MTDADVSQYQADQAVRDSVVAVSAGEQLSEYQAIEAMLVPSADNVAQMVAEWDAGTEAAFVAEMNGIAGQWGLTSTHFADASGLDPGSVSTASDLLVLGERAMADPVIKRVVALSSVTLPNVSQPIPTYDFVLGEDGIEGIKTGSDTAAGGCFLFADQVEVLGHPEVAYGAVLGQQSPTSTLDAVFGVTLGLVKGLDRVLGGTTLVTRGQQVGTVKAAWGESVPVLAGRTVTVIAAPGATVDTSAHLLRMTGEVVPAGTPVGTLTVHEGGLDAMVPLTTATAMAGPPTSWRLMHF